MGKEEKKKARKSAMNRVMVVLGLRPAADKVDPKKRKKKGNPSMKDLLENY